MISTRLAGKHGQRRRSYPLLAVAWVAALSAASDSLGQEEQEVLIGLTAIGAGTRVQLGEVTDATTSASDDAQLTMEDVVVVRLFVRTDPASMRAVLYSPKAQTMLVLNRLGVDLKLTETGRLEISLAREPEAEGWVDIYHDASALILIEISRATIGLERGSVRVEARANGDMAVLVGAGRAGVTPGDASGGNGVVLIAGQQNAITVSPEGQLSDLRSEEGTGVMMASARGAIIQKSLLPELVQVAERVAEGDIEPPARGSLVPPAAVAVTMRVRDVTPRGTLATQVIAGSQGITLGAVQSTAELFLGRGNAALAVVGARLQRTRIIGSPGTAGATGAPLTVSGELERRFTLIRR